MQHIKPERPFFDAWLRRTRRQLTASGQLSQLAQILANENGGDAAQWRERVRELIDGKLPPTFDLLAQIEALLAKSPAPESEDHTQLPLF